MIGFDRNQQQFDSADWDLVQPWGTTLDVIDEKWYFAVTRIFLNEFWLAQFGGEEGIELGVLADVVVGVDEEGVVEDGVVGLEAEVFVEEPLDEGGVEVGVFLWEGVGLLVD